MITISDLSKSYLNSTGQVQALSNINLEIQSSEIFGLFGKSGSGKSTLLRHLNGLETPSSGHISVLGQNLSTLSKKQLQQIRKKIGVVFQNFNLIYSLNVYKNVALPLEVLSFSKKEISQRVKFLLDVVGLSEKMNTKPGFLSGGQRQRVAIARALATQPDILLCDEPTSALDQETSCSILDLLTKINKEYGVTIVIISHDETNVQSRCHRKARLHHGLLQEICDVA